MGRTEEDRKRKGEEGKKKEGRGRELGIFSPL